jgi:predicted ATPase/DNA-binding winged helix-turn-helix (wHTH) protein
MIVERSTKKAEFDRAAHGPASARTIKVQCRGHNVPEQGQAPIYEYGEWEIDLARRELRARGEPVPVGGRAFEIIGVLVQLAGKLVTKDEIMRRVWPGTVVEENALQVHISAVRKALGADRKILQTASGRGYRLLGVWTIRQSGTSTDKVSPEPTPTSDLHFKNNLPLATSDLIGREAEAQRLRDLLSAYRIVTLTGPGGIGKTRLALEVAHRFLPIFQGEVFLVELASISNPDLVYSAVARALSLQLGGGEISAQGVARTIAGKKLLLVLDNCEHMIDAVAELAETIATLCPYVTVLATSREVLRIDGEYVYRVPPLEVPADNQVEPDLVAAHSAVQLFIAKAKLLSSDFRADRESLLHIATICRQLDGIPLAIEFAAARATTLGVQQVVSGLNDRFGLLTSGRRTALPRHQTLRATLDWSHELLPQFEQLLLRNLAIFPAGFTLNAAAAVMDESGAATSLIANGISNLVVKSLITPESSASSTRWRLLETIRLYALEKLAESGNGGQVARRHAQFFRDFFVGAAAGLDSRAAVDSMVRYGQEIDNVRAALDWCFSQSGETAIGVDLTAAYAPAWLHFESMTECRERIEQALERAGSTLNLSADLELQLQIARVVTLFFTLGPVAKVKLALARVFEIVETVKGEHERLRALMVLWGFNLNIGECRLAQSNAERFRHLVRRAHDSADRLIGDRLLGSTLHYGGNQKQARYYLERVLALASAPSNQRYLPSFAYFPGVMTRARLARVLLLQGLVDQAIEQAQASVDEAEATGHKTSMCWAYRLASCPIALITRNLDTALSATTVFASLARNLNAPFWKILAHCMEGQLLVAAGEFEAGTALLQDIERCNSTGWTICVLESLGALAEGLGGLNRIPEAFAAIDQALFKANTGGERWCVPELLRVKGELLLREEGRETTSLAENCFRKALRLAWEQDALFWQLRTALSVARLRMTQNRREQARNTLAPVYQRFTEGFASVDLRSAAALLETLPG